MLCLDFIGDIQDNIRGIVDVVASLQHTHKNVAQLCPVQITKTPQMTPHDGLGFVLTDQSPFSVGFGTIYICLYIYMYLCIFYFL